MARNGQTDLSAAARACRVTCGLAEGKVLMVGKREGDTSRFPYPALEARRVVSVTTRQPHDWRRRAKALGPSRIQSVADERVVARWLEDE